MYILRTYIGGGGCEWDPVKAEANLAKHGVDFVEAAVALEDGRALTLEDDASIGEARWITLGRAVTGQLVVVVYTWRGDRARLISARRATPRERHRYEEGLWTK